MNAITCRSCGAGLEAGRIDSDLGVVTCSHCGSLHELPQSMGGKADSATGSGNASGRSRAEVGLPERFDVKRGASSLEVSWPVGQAIQGVVLLVIAGAFLYVAVTSGHLILLPVVLAIIYFAAVRAFNRNRVRVDAARVDVSQGPLPWPGAQKLDASSIEQLFVSEHESRVETGSDGDRRVEIRRHYRLSAATTDKRRVVLLSDPGGALQGLWLEQEIERVLGIGDKAVAGSHTL